MTETLLIRDAHLLDPAAGTLSELSWMELSGGLIADSGTGTPPSPTPDTQVIDAAGATVMPGLVDAHVHLILTTFDLVDAASWTAGYSTVRALAEAGRMLRRGFTTVRDVGGADWGMARALDEGLAVGPRLVFGGKALSQTGATVICVPGVTSSCRAARPAPRSPVSPTGSRPSATLRAMNFAMGPRT